MKTRLSNSSITTFLECGLKYDLHYNKKIRPLKTKSALVFGGSIDIGLNALLEGKSLEAAQTIFFNEWVKYRDDELITYSKSDLDIELVNHYNKDQVKNPSWTSLFIKGNLMLKTYYKEIIPRIKKVIAIQKDVELTNSEGDKIVGIIDLEVEWYDGKIYIADNKTSSIKYSPNSAKENRQLVTYYYTEKDKLKLDGVMYIVLDKKINLNKVKKCQSCGTINKSSHKTCNEQRGIINPIDNSEGPKFFRCNGEFTVTLDPKAMYEVIIN